MALSSSAYAKAAAKSVVSFERHAYVSGYKLRLLQPMAPGATYHSGDREGAPTAGMMRKRGGALLRRSWKVHASAKEEWGGGVRRH